MPPPLLCLTRAICVAAAMTLGTAASAASPEAEQAEEAPGVPKVTISRIDGVRLRDDRATLDLTLEVANPKGVPLALQALRFQCFFGGAAVAQGQSRAPVEIPANGRASLPVSVDVDSTGFLNLASVLSSGRAVSYRIEGIAEVGLAGFPVPFSYSGTVGSGG